MIGLVRIEMEGDTTHSLQAEKLIATFPAQKPRKAAFQCNLTNSPRGLY
jgi:hypothetical protein